MIFSPPAAEVRSAEGVEGRRGDLLGDHDGGGRHRHPGIVGIRRAWDRLLHHPSEEALRIRGEY